MKQSKYINSLDGCKIAVDIFMPEQTDKKAPLVAAAALTGRKHLYNWYRDFIDKLLDQNYAVALIDPRGIGASYGIRDGFFGAVDAKDMAFVLDALAQEDWCNKNVGMFGASNVGFIQLLTAAERPRHLKAIIPRDCNTDFYYQNFVNGATVLPSTVGSFLVPLDDDEMVEEKDKEQLQLMHTKNLSIGQQYHQNMFRDTHNTLIGYAPNIEIPAWNRMDNVRYSDISVYYCGGWYDSNATGIVVANKSWGGKLLLGPWKHVEVMELPNSFPNSAFNWQDEYISFFDKTLKGIDNGATEKPPVRYYTINESPGHEWKYAPVWPVDGTEWTDLYFEVCGQNSNSGDALNPQKDDVQRFISYKVDTSVDLKMGYGRANRALGSSFSDQEKCICFTSEVFPVDVEITGIPVADLWATSSHKDGIFIGILEEVTPDGTLYYITDGGIRATHAKIHPEESWEALGIPYHRGFEEDAEYFDPEKPLNLKFNLEAISYVLRKGSKLRFCICCGAEGTYIQPDNFPDDVTIRLQTGGQYASYLRLPSVDYVSTFTGELKLDLPGAQFNGNAAMHVFEKAVYVNFADQWRCFPCRQVYKDGGDVVYETSEFNVRKRVSKNRVLVSVKSGNVRFTAQTDRPDRRQFSQATIEIPKYRPVQEMPAFVKDYRYCRNIHVATVPNRKGAHGFPNVQPYDVMPLLMDLLLPVKNLDEHLAPFPCIVYIHGYGGSQHEFPDITLDFLKKGYAVASVDYRIYPPNMWPAPVHDVKGMIRYLKAHSQEYNLDCSRFGVIGGSAGGHLSAMIAATNGSAETEGKIGGNTEYSSSISAAAIYFPWTDIFGFGDDIRSQYPDEPNRILKADGPYAPLGAIVGFGGPGKGIGELKKHLDDHDEQYDKFLDLAKAASPISHVNQNSAPSVFVHGIFECGIEIPMGQSVRMFRELTQYGVKSLLLCNNNCIYGSDPEVNQAVLDFMVNRI